MFKKFLLSVLTVAMISLFVGCSEPPVTRDEGVHNGQPESQEEKVILDNEVITATYQGVTDAPDIGYFYIKLKVENKTDEEIWVSLDSGDVDGETVPLIVTGVPVYIRSGNSYAAAFGFPTMNLSINSSKDAKAATFKIVVRDKETLVDVIFESDLITVELNK